MDRKRLRVGSLFSGIGGIELGLERSGEFDTVYLSEIYEPARCVLRRHFPEAKLYGSVEEISFNTRKPEGRGQHLRGRVSANDTRWETGAGIPDSSTGDGGGTEDGDSGTNLPWVDVITGGFPCQDVSVAGRRAGLDGERTGLFWEFHRIVDETRPRWFIAENVPGLFSSNGGNDFAFILRGLADIGYGVAWRLLDSQYFSVPQRRRRVFLVGCLGDPRPAFRALHPVGTGLRGDTPTIRVPEQDAPDGTERSTGERVWPDKAMPLMARDYKGPRNYRDGGLQACVADPILTREGSTYTHEGSTLRMHNTVAATLVNPGKQWNSFQNLPNLVAEEPVAYHDVAPTLFGSGAGTSRVASAGSESEFIVGPVLRRLTPVECERLQGLPDGYTGWGIKEDGTRVDFKDTPRYKMLGNAVTTTVANWIGHQIAEIENES
jgi:DNA (cytosine-5)-methyltransferase 1